MTWLRRPVLLSLLVALFVGLPLVPPVFAGWTWDAFTKVTLSERAAAGPGLVFNDALGKMFLSWVGINCCGHNLNFISSGDMFTWSGKVTTGLSASAEAACIEGTDMTYNPHDQNMYVTYLHVDNSVLGGCEANHLYVFHTADGTVISSQALVTTSACPSCVSEAQMTGASIAYDTVNRRFVVVNVQRLNDQGTIFMYQSTDGVTWDSGQVLPVSTGPVAAERPEIRFINGKFFLTYVALVGTSHIRQSQDLNTWISLSDPAIQAVAPPRLSYNVAEARYHLTWMGTDGKIHDAVSNDAASWFSETVSEAAFDTPAVAYNPITEALLVAWTGTDCCIGGSLNVKQYRLVDTGGPPFGSVAYGTLITMADGSLVPVQNLKVGDKMLGYDTVTLKFTVSTIRSIEAVDTSNMLVVNTEAGTPARVDANPAQTMWTMRTDGSILWLPVTQLQPGDHLFTKEGWVKVTGIQFAALGRHVMFDIVATAPYFASGYLDPIFKR